MPNAKKVLKPKKKDKENTNSLSNVIMSVPFIVWIIALVVMPIAYLIFMSFMTKAPMGSIKYIFSVESYKNIANPIYFKVLIKSLKIAAITTIVCVLTGYPLAYFIAQRKKSTSATLELLLMVPFWTCVLVVIYSFVILLNNAGIVNTFLQKIGLIKEPLSLLYNDGAVIVGMWYMCIPFCVMPMYSSIEKVDKTMLEASKDLGANPVTTFFKITLPLTAPGIMAAVILTFIPSIGYYQITDMLGGGTSIMLGNVIYNQFTSARNWPFGAALSVVLIVVILLMMWIFRKLGGNSDELI